VAGAAGAGAAGVIGNAEGAAGAGAACVIGDAEGADPDG